jgi:hypothetical protein
MISGRDDVTSGRPGSLSFLRCMMGEANFAWISAIGWNRYRGRRPYARRRNILSTTNQTGAVIKAASIAIAAAATLLCAPAYADQGACAVAEGNAILKNTMGGPPSNDIAVAQLLQRDCEPGRVIGIPADMLYVIGTVCDFSKSVFRASATQTMCVMKSP